MSAQKKPLLNRVGEIRESHITGQQYEIEEIQGDNVVVRNTGSINRRTTVLSANFFSAMKLIRIGSEDASPAILTSEAKVRAAIESVYQRCEDNSSLHWPDELEKELGFDG
jgi:hypothetical protein